MTNREKAPNYFVEHLWSAEIPRELSNAYLEDREQALPKVIYPDIRVLTANKGTQNDTYYPEESLRGDPERGTGLITFTRPYPIPLLRDHLDTPNPNGGYSSEVYGRIYHPAQIHSNGSDKYVRCMGTITHPEAIEAILTGRWLTVSLGSKTDSVHCSICKSSLLEGLCDHQKGRMYEVDDKPEQKERCRWIIGPIKAREISFVVSPSDDQAGILAPNLKESTSSFTSVLPRLLVGDDRGIFDLATGEEVEESSLFLKPNTTRTFGGLSILNSGVSLKESVGKTAISKSHRPDGISLKEDFIGPGKYLLSGWDHDHTVVLDQRGDGTSTPSQMPPTQFQSPGYMYPTMSEGKEALGGTGPAKGRGMGDGDNTRPDPAPVQVGDQEDHTHEVLGGRVMKAGYPTHSHDLEPANAALENTMSKKNKMVENSTTEPNDDLPVTLGVLYNLPETNPDYNTPDDVEESVNEADGTIIEAKLTYKARKALPEGSFCGPDRSFPAHDAAHVRNGLARLSQSNFSSDQKASIHSCLSGRAKKYGIKVGGKENYAARVIDTTHRIEMGLYPMPNAWKEAKELVEQVNSAPHTPSEKEGILSRIAAHCKDIIPMSSWQSLFGELSSCEAGDPLEILINSENYGLLYSLNLQISSDPIPTTEAKKSEGNEEGEKTTKESVEDKETEEGVPIIPLPTQALASDENTESIDSPAADIVRETIKDLKGKVSESQQQARYALAHSAAIYMKMLRKPLARDKNNQELIELLSKRSTESLQDTLNDLLAELDMNGGITPIQPLPKIQDPTMDDTVESMKKDGKVLVSKVEETTDTDKYEKVGPSARLSLLQELEDDEDEVFSVLTELYNHDVRLARKS